MIGLFGHALPDEPLILATLQHELQANCVGEGRDSPRREQILRRTKMIYGAAPSPISANGPQIAGYALRGEEASAR